MHTKIITDMARERISLTLEQMARFLLFQMTFSLVIWNDKNIAASLFGDGQNQNQKQRNATWQKQNLSDRMTPSTSWSQQFSFGDQAGEPRRRRSALGCFLRRAVAFTTLLIIPKFNLLWILTAQ